MSSSLQIPKGSLDKAFQQLSDGDVSAREFLGEPDGRSGFVQLFRYTYGTSLDPALGGVWKELKRDGGPTADDWGLMLELRRRWFEEFVLIASEAVSTAQKVLRTTRPPKSIPISKRRLARSAAVLSTLKPAFPEVYQRTYSSVSLDSETRTPTLRGLISTEFSALKNEWRNGDADAARDRWSMLLDWQVQVGRLLMCGFANYLIQRRAEHPDTELSDYAASMYWTLLQRLCSKPAKFAKIQAEFFSLENEHEVATLYLETYLRMSSDLRVSSSRLSDADVASDLCEIPKVEVLMKGLSRKRLPRKWQKAIAFGAGLRDGMLDALRDLYSRPDYAALSSAAEHLVTCQEGNEVFRKLAQFGFSRFTKGMYSDWLAGRERMSETDSAHLFRAMHSLNHFLRVGKARRLTDREIGELKNLDAVCSEFRTHLRNGRLDKVEELQRILGLARDVKYRYVDNAILDLLADFHISLKDFRSATNHIYMMRLSDATQRSRAYQKTGRIHHIQGMASGIPEERERLLAKAIRWFDSAIDINRDASESERSLSPYLGKAQVLRHLRQYDGALDVLASIRSSNDREPHKTLTEIAKTYLDRYLDKNIGGDRADLERAWDEVCKVIRAADSKLGDFVGVDLAIEIAQLAPEQLDISLLIVDESLPDLVRSQLIRVCTAEGIFNDGLLTSAIQLMKGSPRVRKAVQSHLRHFIHQSVLRNDPVDLERSTSVLVERFMNADLASSSWVALLRPKPREFIEKWKEAFSERLLTIWNDGSAEVLNRAVDCRTNSELRDLIDGMLTMPLRELLSRFPFSLTDKVYRGGGISGHSYWFKELFADVVSPRLSTDLEPLEIVEDQDFGHGLVISDANESVNFEVSETWAEGFSRDIQMMISSANEMKRLERLGVRSLRFAFVRGKDCLTSNALISFDPSVPRERARNAIPAKIGNWRLLTGPRSGLASFVSSTPVPPTNNLSPEWKSFQRTASKYEGNHSRAAFESCSAAFPSRSRTSIGEWRRNAEHFIRDQYDRYLNDLAHEYSQVVQPILHQVDKVPTRTANTGVILAVNVSSLRAELLALEKQFLAATLAFQSMEPRPTEFVGAFSRRAGAILRRFAERIQLTVDSDLRRQWVFTSDFDIYQILFNILDNAIRAIYLSEDFSQQHILVMFNSVDDREFRVSIENTGVATMPRHSGQGKVIVERALYRIGGRLDWCDELPAERHPYRFGWTITLPRYSGAEEQVTR